jgi:hypothetical protein
MALPGDPSCRRVCKPANLPPLRDGKPRRRALPDCLRELRSLSVNDGEEVTYGVVTRNKEEMTWTEFDVAFSR